MLEVKPVEEMPGAYGAIPAFIVRKRVIVDALDIAVAIQLTSS